MGHNILEIPKEIAEFEEKTLILVLSHYKAQPYLGKQRTLEVMDELHTVGTEDAGKAHTPDFGTGDLHQKDHYERVLMNYLHDKLMHYYETGMFTKLVIFVPPDLKQTTEEKLPKNLEKLTKIIVSNEVHAHPIDLIAKIRELPEK